MPREGFAILGLVLLVVAFLLAFLAGATSGIPIFYGSGMLYGSIAIIPMAGAIAALWWSSVMEVRPMRIGDVAEVIAHVAEDGVTRYWVQLLSQKGRTEITAPELGSDLEPGTQITQTRLEFKVLVKRKSSRQTEEENG